MSPRFSKTEESRRRPEPKSKALAAHRGQLQLKAQGARATDHVLDPPRGMDLPHLKSGVIKVRTVVH
jgi:hypothetical protein